MLVLTRKMGERLFISDPQVVVTVLAVRGDRVRLGITAPPQVAIHREEVLFGNKALVGQAKVDLS